MIIYFADRKMNILGQASTGLPEGVQIIDDLKTEEISVGVATFSFSIPYVQKTRKQAEACTSVGNYILRQSENTTEFYTIIDTENDTKKSEIYVYAEDAGLDLLNEINGPYEADKAYPISHYIEFFAMDTGFQININEIQNLTRTLKWEGEETTTARLLSVATQFDNVEISYEFVIKNMRVVKKYINIMKSRGKDTCITLALNREVDKIITKKSIENLATGLYVTGGKLDGQENSITLEGYKYDDGRFYTSGAYLFDREANAIWNRFLMGGLNGESYIVQQFSYDTTSQSELCNRAVSKLKKISEIELNYEIDISELPSGVSIGDNINIVDEEGELYLNARILRMEKSDANKTYKATLGNYLIRNSGISKKVEELAEQFKNIASSRTLYTWIAYANDSKGGGISIDPAGKKYMGTATNKLTADPDISDSGIYSWALIQGEGKKGEDAILLQIESSNGRVFKNSGVSTTLTVNIIVGEIWINTSDKMRERFGEQAFIQWESKRLGELEFSTIAQDDTRLSDDGFIFTLRPQDVDMKMTLNCNLIYEEEIINGSKSK